MLRLAAEHGGNPDDPAKRDPLDFVLWQPSLPDEPAWESRWGPGRPGWHIECSALALRELGETIDVHGGGRDLVFPHHECETAQSEAVTGGPSSATGCTWAWSGLDGEKMSKSLGNLVFVGDLVKEWEPMAVRLALLAHHYREDWEWHDPATSTAAAAPAGAVAGGRRPGHERATALRWPASGAASTTTSTPRRAALALDALAAGRSAGGRRRRACSASSSESARRPERHGAGAGAAAAARVASAGRRAGPMPAVRAGPSDQSNDKELGMPAP